MDIVEQIKEKLETVDFVDVHLYCNEIYHKIDAECKWRQVRIFKHEDVLGVLEAIVGHTAYIYEIFFPSELTFELLNKVDLFVREKHKNQTRSDRKTPYYEHIRRVTNRVSSIEAKMVALLHDTLEDTDTTDVDLLNLGVPSRIVSAVSLLTHDKKNMSYIDYVRKVKTDFLSVEVKLADMKDNISDNPTTNQIVKYSKAFLELLNRK